MWCSGLQDARLSGFRALSVLVCCVCGCPACLCVVVGGFMSGLGTQASGGTPPVLVLFVLQLALDRGIDAFFAVWVSQGAAVVATVSAFHPLQGQGACAAGFAHGSSRNPRSTSALEPCATCSSQICPPARQSTCTSLRRAVCARIDLPRHTRHGCGATLCCFSKPTRSLGHGNACGTWPLMALCMCGDKAQSSTWPYTCTPRRPQRMQSCRVPLDVIPMIWTAEGMMQGQLHHCYRV